MIIGLVGYKGAGKSHVASILQKHHGFSLLKATTSLKDMCRSLGLNEDELNGGLKETVSETVTALSQRPTPPEVLREAVYAMDVDFEHEYGWDTEEIVDSLADHLPYIGQTPRSMMEYLGAVWAQEKISSDLWTRGYRNKLEELGTTANVVTDDVNFVGEADAVTDLCGHLVRIERPGVTSRFITDESADRIRCDHVLKNNGNLTQLVLSTHALVKHADQLDEAAGALPMDLVKPGLVSDG